MLLRRLGHRVEVAENGAVAVKLFQKSLSTSENTTRATSSFDVILMDLQMPVMDGLEATRRIRCIEKDSLISVSKNIQSTQPLLVVGISANADEDTKQVASDAGFDLFLSKPFDLEKVQSLLQNCNLCLSTKV
jgi:CheY-like chemotaxis protein